MCNANAAMAMQGASAASTAVSSYYGAISNQKTLGLRATLDEINARASESTAQSVLLAGQRDEQKSRIASANLKGSQRASMAANGIDLGVGTAERVLTSTDVLGEIDANTINANAVRSAWGYRTQGVNQSNQALMSRAAADAVNPGGEAFSSLLSGAGKVAGMWYQFKGK